MATGAHVACTRLLSDDFSPESETFHAADLFELADAELTKNMSELSGAALGTLHQLAADNRIKTAYLLSVDGTHGSTGLGGLQTEEAAEVGDRELRLARLLPIYDVAAEVTAPLKLAYHHTEAVFVGADLAAFAEDHRVLHN